MAMTDLDYADCGKESENLRTSQTKFWSLSLDPKKAVTEQRVIALHVGMWWELGQKSPLSH